MLRLLAASAVMSMMVGLVAAAPAQAADQVAPTARTTAAASEAADTKMPQAEFYALKDRLEAPGSGFTYTSRPVAGGTEFTYTHVNGTVLALAVPSTTSTPSPDLRAGGCGFLQLCIFFNRSDQAALLSGAGAGIAAAICRLATITGPACGLAAAVVAVATYYLIENGRCPGDLRVRILPFVGQERCV